MFSKDTFCNGVRATLPLDPPLASNHSWDAINDSLWSGLELLPEEKLLIIWRTASEMRAHDIHNFKIACDTLEDLPKYICDSKKREGKEASLAIVVVV
ncbi:barstar family protein [uncultured Aquitalea sp.]|uniref:barstar family protein n=1 Tax=uncultured Aquitalea sp. TaxID=540272 RepID=UPI0025CF7397|nr:barstar family protein [uncultured Aquitalea sp.]